MMYGSCVVTRRTPIALPRPQRHFDILVADRAAVRARDGQLLEIELRVVRRPERPGPKNSTCCMPAEIGSSGSNGCGVPCGCRGLRRRKSIRGQMSPSFGSGLKSCQTISSPYISTPSSFHNCEMSPFGSGCPPPPNMPIMPPGGRFGCAVPTTSPHRAATGTDLRRSPSAGRLHRRDEILHRFRR